ncbi:MAG TPA: molybdopterin-binding protein [Phnomibacter sp.]|nr:molybdopterin-binding protein [Phnomibacter sp.]
MKQVLLLLSSIMVCTIVLAQSTVQIAIEGAVEKPLIITAQEVFSAPTKNLGTFKVTNHLGEFRKAYKNVKGVPILPFLQKVSITSPSPKQLSEYYLVFKASDNYTVIASWNEVFNTDLGSSFYIITHADGKSLQQEGESLLMIATKDKMTGRRHVKGLQSITIKRYQP